MPRRGALRMIYNGVECPWRDVVFGDKRNDARLAGISFPDSPSLRSEVPSRDGDLDLPNVNMRSDNAVSQRKIGLLHACFATQRSKDWCDPEIFRGSAHLRGKECRVPARYAEAFVRRKATSGQEASRHRLPATRCMVETPNEVPSRDLLDRRLGGNDRRQRIRAFGAAGFRCDPATGAGHPGPCPTGRSCKRADNSFAALSSFC